MINLTQNEITALKTCIYHKDRESQLNDNFSDCGAPELKEALGWNDKQVAALIGRLEEKNMGYGDDNQGNGHIFWLSELGVNTIFDIIEAESKKPRLIVNIKDAGNNEYFEVYVHEESPDGTKAGDIGFKGFDSKKEIFDFYNKYMGKTHNVIFKGDK